MDIPRFLILLGVCFCISMFLIVRLTPIARKIDLVDRPSARKVHRDNVPLVGGISIASSLFLVLLLSSISLQPYRVLFFSLACLLFIGMLDDHRDIRPVTKLVGQLVAASVLVYFGGFNLGNIGDVWALGYDQSLGVLDAPLTILFLVVVVNSFNMLDGHDGVLGFVSGATLLGIGYLVYRSENRSDLQVILLCIVAIAPFLAVNIKLLGRRVSKVFLGDAGSMFLGFFIAFFVVRTTEIELTRLTSPGIPFFLGVPLLDFFRVILVRAVNGAALWRADRIHLHHLLLERIQNKHIVLLIIVILHVVMVMLGVMLAIQEVSDQIVLITYVIIFLAYLPCGLLLRSATNS